MVNHHEQEHTDELGDGEKIGQGQILKGLNSPGTGEPLFFWKQPRNTIGFGSSKNLWDRAEDRIGVGGNLFILPGVKLRGDIPVPQNSFKTEYRKSLAGQKSRWQSSVEP